VIKVNIEKVKHQIFEVRVWSIFRVSHAGKNSRSREHRDFLLHKSSVLMPWCLN
jgi:hypothetical protein